MPQSDGCPQVGQRYFDELAVWSDHRKLERKRNWRECDYLEDLGEDGGGEEGGVLDDNEVTLVLIGHLKLVQDGVCRLAHNHGAEQLASQPCAAAWGNPLLDDGHLDSVQDI